MTMRTTIPAILSLFAGIVLATAATAQNQPRGRDLSVITEGIAKPTKNRDLAGTPKKYVVAIDFCHSDLSDTGTANELIIRLSGPAGEAGSRRVRGTATCSPFGAPVSADLRVGIDSFLDVTKVLIETTGGDGLFIDEVEVFRDGTKILWDGRDNGGGWCLSTDANDHLGGWETVLNGCARSQSFKNPA